MNNCTLIGRLTKDPELRYTANNFPMCSFTLAIDRMGKEEKKTNFIPIKVLGRLAENCAKYLSKGKLASAEGEIQTDSYEAKDGSKRYTWEVLAYRVEFLERKDIASHTTADNPHDVTMEANDISDIRNTINQKLGITPRMEDPMDDIPF